MKPARRRRPGLVGPLFYWELVRLARRGQDARARFIFAGALFVILGLFTISYFPGTPLSQLFTGTSQSLSLEQSARFGDRFATTFIVGQLLILALLTPAYAAGGISEEKERKTLDFVLTSELTSREIVFGKFLGRLTFLLGVLFAGLPILSITQLYGGVSFDFLVTSYLVTASTVTMLAAISAACACAVNTYRGALFRAYGLTVLHVAIGCVHPLISPVAIIIFLNGLGGSPGIWYLAGVFSTAQLAVAVAAVIYAVFTIRKMRSRAGSPPRPPREAELTPVILPESANVAELPTARRVAAPPPRREPPPAYLPPEVRRRPRVFADDPFTWKERYTTGQKQTADDESMRGVLLAGGIFVGVVLLVVALIAITQALNGNPAGAAWLLLIPGTALLAVYTLQVGAAAAGMVIREQQRMTLESLLTMPVDRNEILRAKWVAAAIKGWVWGLPALALVPLGFLTTDSPFTAVPMALVPLAAIAAVTSAGLWLSVRCDTLTRATLWLLTLVGALVAAVMGVWAITGGDRVTPAVAASTLVLTLAGVAWWAWRRATREFELLARD